MARYLNKLFVEIYIRLLSAGVQVYHMVPMEVREGLGVVDGCELPRGFWELSLGPLQEQHVHALNCRATHPAPSWKALCVGYCPVRTADHPDSCGSCCMCSPSPGAAGGAFSPL